MRGNAVHVHGGEDLQIEDVASGYWSATKQANKFLNSVPARATRAENRATRKSRREHGFATRRGLVTTE